MSFDIQLLTRHVGRWADAEFVALPEQPWHPVIWVDPNERLALYHPAVPSDVEYSAVPMRWDKKTFASMVEFLQKESRAVIEKRCQALGLPTSYFAEYPKAVRDAQARLPKK